jgi:hypothetical protein
MRIHIHLAEEQLVGTFLGFPDNYFFGLDNAVIRRIRRDAGTGYFV